MCLAGVASAAEPAATGSDHLVLELRAPQGHMGTGDCRIVFEAAPLDAARSVVHMTYSSAYSATSRLAMHTYLATLAKGKIGFSTARRRSSLSAAIPAACALP